MKNTMKFVALSIMFLIGCFTFVVVFFYTDPTTNSRDDAENSTLISTLQKADSIEIRKVYAHINKKYEIFVNDNLAGYITSNNPIFMGKTFKLRDLDGNVIRSETEHKRILLEYNRSAKFFNYKGAETLKIEENKMKNVLEANPEYRFCIVNSDNITIGYTKAKFFSLIKAKHTILDKSGNELYKIEKSNILPKRYTIEVVKRRSEIDVLDTVLYTAVNDSIISFSKTSKN